MPVGLPGQLRAGVRTRSYRGRPPAPAWPPHVGAADPRTDGPPVRPPAAARSRGGTAFSA